MLTLWIVMIAGWMLVGELARRNYVKKRKLEVQEKAHQAALNKEFHDSFKAGWNAAITDPIIVNSAYKRIFKQRQPE